MRAKTSDFLKVLNRARPEAKNMEKKTITYVVNSFYLFFNNTIDCFFFYFLFIGGEHLYAKNDLWTMSSCFFFY